MAKLVVAYTPDGKVKNELTYKGDVFSYTMIPDEFGKVGDNKAFDLQVIEKYPDESDEVMEALGELGFADEDEIGDYLNILSENE